MGAEAHTLGVGVGGGDSGAGVGMSHLVVNR